MITLNMNLFSICDLVNTNCDMHLNTISTYLISVSIFVMQKKDKPAVGRASRRSSSEASDREDSQNAKRDPGTGRRRRSVRFKDTQEEEPKGSDEANQGGNKLTKAQEEENRLTGAKEGENKLMPQDKSEGAGDEISGLDEFEAVWDQALSKMVDEGK